jgi:hypothetical protein
MVSNKSFMFFECLLSPPPQFQVTKLSGARVAFSFKISDDRCFYSIDCRNYTYRPGDGLTYSDMMLMPSFKKFRELLEAFWKGEQAH